MVNGSRKGIGGSWFPRFMVVILSGFAANQHLTGAEQELSNVKPPISLWISDRVIHGVSLNDARAALAVWSTEIGKVAGFTLTSQQNIVVPSQVLLEAIRGGKVDLFCLSTEEYREVAKFVDNNHILIDDRGGEDLLILVREGSGISDLAGLRGRSLILLDDVAASLAEPWLAVETWREVHEMPGQLLRTITRNSKLAQTVLPVFFGQVDACIVTRRGLETMSEMNPQISRKLHVLMSLPKVPGGVLACRRDYRNGKTLMEHILDSRSTVAAKQALMLFQTTGFSMHNSDCLKTSLAVLDAYARLNEHSPKNK